MKQRSNKNPNKSRFYNMSAIMNFKNPPDENSFEDTDSVMSQTRENSLERRYVIFDI